MKTVTATASILLGLVLSLTAALGIAAMANTRSPPSLMSRVDYVSALGAVRGQARLALGECRALEPDARAPCRARARAAEQVANARLEASYLGTVEARERARLVLARAARSVTMSTGL